MLITSKGQVTIPQNLRNQLGFLPHTEVLFEAMGNCIKIKKDSKALHRGQQFITHMKGQGNVKLSTDQIMAMTRRD